jgi:aspartyl-tRNA(Asn)/glutamyl-tRNA(Gln) amidotransferase subunit B
MISEKRVAASKDWIKGATGDWEIIIGLEVHAQVTSKSKLFSGASADFGGEPNDHVSLVDAAMPGMLPVINEYCVEQAVRTGLGLKAKINNYSIFDRKNYFYPDLPQGYQISQYKQPVVGEGVVTIDLDDGKTVDVGIERLHLEQDAGKSIHDQHPNMSFVDLNRSGCALMEIVSKPDMRSSDEARAYVTKLRQIMRYLGTCDGNMEQGSLRADVNVSVRKPGDKFGTRCEIKNVNSVRFMGQAIEFEARRQIGILEDGGKIDQETRLYDPKKGETRSMRSKEEAHDYRYFPDPDLLPLEFTDDWVAGIKDSLPELPDEKIFRFVMIDGLIPYNAKVLAAERARADYYEATLELLAERAKNIGKVRVSGIVCGWVISELLGKLNKLGMDIADCPVSPKQLAEIIDMKIGGSINNMIGKLVLDKLFTEGGSAKDIVKKLNLGQITDTGAIERAVNEIIAQNPDKIAAVVAKPSMLGWFVGQVMKSTGGKANPQAVNDLLRQKLGIN